MADPGTSDRAPKGRVAFRGTWIPAGVLLVILVSRLNGLPSADWAAAGVGTIGGAVAGVAATSSVGRRGSDPTRTAKRRLAAAAIIWPGIFVAAVVLWFPVTGAAVAVFVGAGAFLIGIMIAVFLSPKETEPRARPNAQVAGREDECRVEFERDEYLGPGPQRMDFRPSAARRWGFLALTVCLVVLFSILPLRGFPLSQIVLTMIVLVASTVDAWSTRVVAEGRTLRLMRPFRSRSVDLANLVDVRIRFPFPALLLRDDEGRHLGIPLARWARADDAALRARVLWFVDHSRVLIDASVYNFLNRSWTRMYL